MFEVFLEEEQQQEGLFPRLSLGGKSSKCHVASDWRSVLLDISPVGR